MSRTSKRNFIETVLGLAWKKGIESDERESDFWLIWDFGYKLKCGLVVKWAVAFDQLQRIKLTPWLRQ